MTAPTGSTPSPAPSANLTAIADSIKSTAISQIDAAVSGFTSSHPEIVSFVGSMSLTLAEALLMYGITSDPPTKQSYLDAINAEKDAMKEESWSVLVDIEKSSASLIVTILTTAWNMISAAAPLAIKAATGGVL